MPDQLLRAHEVMEYVYNVADVSYPVSIRDQMNRAAWMVQKAYDMGFFGPVRQAAYRKLLVCGAGAAGVTAAIQALHLNIETHLVEKSRAPFLRQRLCRSRWIDPTQYDWPAPMWPHGHFPYPPAPAMPLPWSAGRSTQLAFRWRPLVSRARTNPLLSYRRDYVVGAPAPSRDAQGNVVGVDVTFQSGRTETYGMMLWCIGFGDERRVAPPTYKGFAFWETDPFERKGWGIAPTQHPQGALVSGGGDGALQDVVRLVTLKKSAVDVLNELRRFGWVTPRDAEYFLLSAEDQSQRALLWAAPGSVDEHKILQTLHNEYLGVVNHLLQRHPGKDVLIAALKTILSACPHPVTLVYSCTHFGRCYGLNHFLVLLLAAMRDKLTILDQHRVNQVRGIPAGHTCGTPATCHGVEHEVSLEHKALCYGPIGQPAGNVNATVVVIRHGIQPNPVVAGTLMAFARQVMPYHLP